MSNPMTAGLAGNAMGQQPATGPAGFGGGGGPVGMANLMNQ